MSRRDNGIEPCDKFEVRECDYRGDRRTIKTVGRFDTHEQAIAFYESLPADNRWRCHIQHPTTGMSYRQGKLPVWRFRPVKWARNAPKEALG